MHVAEELYQSSYQTISKYVDILASTGVTWGLIGPREVDRLWTRHILNSAALADLVPVDATVIDVGSGAGLPGLPLAVLRPDLRVTLLESLLRRATFLTETVAALGLSERVTVVRGRAEEHDGRYDAVVSRAVAPLDRLIGWCAPLRAPGGQILALKGQSAAAELASAAGALRSRRLQADVRTVRAHPDAEPATVVVIR